MSKTTRDLLIALSLANLCFVSGWQVLLNPLHYTYYYWKYHPGFIEYAALVCNVLLLAALFWGTITLARRSGNQFVLRVARWAFLLILIVPFNNLRLQIFDPLDANATRRLVSALVTILFLLPLLVAVVLKRWREKLIRGAAIVILILFPFFLIALFQGAWLTIKYRSNAQFFRTESLAPALNSKQGSQRVVLLVFDELDQRMAFAERPAGVELPEFDRLRGEAFFANTAYPPESGTLLSLPALTIGKRILAAQPARPNELTLTIKDSKEEVGWSTQPNVFSAARAQGFDTALVGWYHPYCRVIGNSLTNCFWEPVVDAVTPLRGEPTMRKSMAHWVETALFRIPGMFRAFQSRYDSERCEAHIEEHLRILEQAKTVARKREFGVTLLHFPIPHHPFIYDRSRNELSSSPDRKYEDNLVLTDRTLGEIRREMEAAGIWKDTTIIVTSDHWWRTPEDGKIDKRVPFILKVAGQQQGVTYDAAFNTVLTSPLIQAILKGELLTPEAAGQWIDQNRSIVEIPGN